MRLGLRTVLWGMVCCLLFISVKAEAKILDRIVATVNGDIITLKQINDRLEPYIEASGVTDKEQINEVRRQILDALIDQALMEQEAQRLKISVTDDDVDDAIERLKRVGNMTQEQFESRVIKQGATMEGVRTDVRSEIMRARVINQEIRSRVIVPPEKVEEILHAQKGEAEYRQAAHVRNILFEIKPGSDTSDGKAVMALAEKVVKEIREGLAFTKAAEMYSDGSNAKQGGEMGLIAWGDMAPAISEALKKLEPGQVTDPIALGPGVQILQLVEKVTEDLRATDEEKMEIRKRLANEMVEEKVVEWLKSLRENAIIKIKF